MHETTGCSGAVAEWSKALAWKVSIRQNRIEGSNPSRPATSVPEWAPRLRECPPPAPEAAVPSIHRCEPHTLPPRHAARAHHDGRGHSLRHEAGCVHGTLRVHTTGYAGFKRF